MNSIKFQVAWGQEWRGFRTFFACKKNTLKLSRRPERSSCWRLWGAGVGCEPGWGCLLHGCGLRMCAWRCVCMSPVGNLWVCGCVMTDEGRLWCNKRHVCICLKTQEFGGCKGLRDDLVWILVLFSFYRWLRGGPASSHSASWSPDSSASLTAQPRPTRFRWTLQLSSDNACWPRLVLGWQRKTRVRSWKGKSACLWQRTRHGAKHHFQ